jgi:hypothetical protein
MRAVEEERNSGSSLDVLRCRGTSQPNPDEESSADDRDRRVHCVSLRVGVISVGPYCLAFVSRAIPNGRIRSSYGSCLALPWEGAGSPEMGDPAWEGGGHVRDGDVAGHFDPGERLHSPRPVGKAWIGRSEAPLARSTALGAVSIGLQRQTIWHASLELRRFVRRLGWPSVRSAPVRSPWQDVATQADIALTETILNVLRACCHSSTSPPTCGGT